MQEPHNPYAAPKAPVGKYEERREVVPADKGLRFGGLVVDYAGIFFFSMLLWFSIGYFGGADGVAAFKSIPSLLRGALVVSIYYLFFEGIWRRTPGKWTFGTAVVDEDGLKPSFGAIALRTICRLIPFEQFSFFGERGWHDMIPNTYVIKVRGQ